MPEVVEKAAKASSMKGNPIVLTPDELRWILERAILPDTANSENLI
jgi:alcohol dehydrogenase class IV